MLLPQSSAFAALKNRLNSVSAIGYLHIAPRAYVQQFRNNNVDLSCSRSSSVSELVSQTFVGPSVSFKRQSSSTESYTSLNSTTAAPGPSNFDRSSRLKGRDEGIKWNELLEKFRNVQERARKAHRTGGEFEDGFDAGAGEGLDSRAFKDFARLPTPVPAIKETPAAAIVPQAQASKSKTSLGKFGRLGGGRPKR
jgi:vacuole morphology and inheritance protein 14